MRLAPFVGLCLLALVAAGLAGWYLMPGLVAAYQVLEVIVWVFWRK